MKVSAKKTPEWESELWSYISKGDGVTCPLYGVDKARHCSEWCFNENAEMFTKLYGNDFICSGNDETDVAVFRDLFEHKFPRKWKPGRVFQLIEVLANKYIEKAKLNRPPVATGIIKQFDVSPHIEIRRLPLEVYNGAIWHLDDGWVIHLNSRDKPARQRLTLFHEVFHILVHSRATPFFRKRGIKKRLFNELLADYFAGCVLMPKEWVREKWVDVNDFKQMAEIFQVTEVSMWIKLKTIGLI